MKRLLLWLPIVAFFLLSAQSYYYPDVPRIDNLLGGGGAAATATPSPGFIVGVAFNAGGNNPTATIPSGHSTPALVGDCAVLVTDTGNTTGSFGENGAGVMGWAFTSVIAAPWTTGTYMSTYAKYITPHDISLGYLQLTGVSTNNRVCIGFYRHVSCTNLDGFAAQAQGSAGLPTLGTATSTVNGDIDIVATIVLQTSAGTYTPDTGYTNDVHFDDGTVGCALDHLVQSTAGATSPTGASWTNNNASGAVHWFMQNIGGTQ